MDCQNLEKATNFKTKTVIMIEKQELFRNLKKTKQSASLIVDRKIFKKLYSNYFLSFFP